MNEYKYPDRGRGSQVHFFFVATAISCVNSQPGLTGLRYDGLCVPLTVVSFGWL